MKPALPAGLLASLAVAPGDAPFALLVRHADRAAIPRGEHGADAPLTETGRLRARALADLDLLRARPLRWCESSPVSRCMETGTHAGLTPRPDRLLGDPGVFVTDTEAAGRAFLSLGTEHVVRAHLGGRPSPFLRSPEDGGRRVLSRLGRILKERGGGGLLVSHDTIVMPIIAWITGHLFEDDWLAPLDGIVVSLGPGGGLAIFWKGKVFDVPP